MVRREKKKGKRTGQSSSGYDQSVAPLQLFWRANFDRLLFPEISWSIAWCSANAPCNAANIFPTPPARGCYDVTARIVRPCLRSYLLTLTGTSLTLVFFFLLASPPTTPPPHDGAPRSIQLAHRKKSSQSALPSDNARAFCGGLNR